MKKEVNPLFNHIRIRQIREYRNISQTELAKLIGLSQSSYNDLEQGHTRIKADSLPTLAAALDVDIRCFFEAETDYRTATNLSDELKVFEDKYYSLRKENQKLNELLLEKQQLYQAYQISCEERSAMKGKVLSRKRFFIKVLLMFSTALIYILIFVIYSEDIQLWISR